MAREVILSIWCDLCMNQDETKVEAEEMPPVMIGNTKPKVLALCKTHQTEFFDVFAEALDRYGEEPDTQQVSPKKKGGGTREAKGGVDRRVIPTGERVLCPAEGCMKDLKNIDSVASHLRTVHNTRMIDVLGKDGMLQDVKGNPVNPGEIRDRQVPPEVTEAICEVTGCTSVFKWPAYGVPKNALAVHMAKSHGIGKMSELDTMGSQRSRKAAQQEMAEAV